MSTVEVLKALTELERRWAPYGGREAMRLRPGLDDATMDALVAPIGYTLDEEQRAWWSWADGNTESDIHYFGRGHVAPGITLLPLSDAVREYQRWATPLDPDGIFPGHWLQLTPGQRPIVSCATGTSRTQMTRFDPISGREPRLESLAHMVDIWVYQWDHGDYRPTTQAPGWTGEDTSHLLPIELDTSGALGPLL